MCLNIENTSGNGGNDDGGDGESNTGAIIGGIIGGLGGLIIISTSTTVVIMCWRNNRKPSADIGKDDVCTYVSTYVGMHTHKIYVYVCTHVQNICITSYTV